MIDIKNLKKSYQDQPVLDIPELHIPRNQCFGLVGNNGAGKTTLFRLILDLIRPTEGEVLLENKNVATHEDWKQHVGAHLDEHMLLGYLTPDEYFETLRKMYGLSHKDVDLHLQTFEPLFNAEITGTSKYIRDLSKGNTKKVGIAAAFFGDPRLILLDEPFENLDPSSQIKLKKLIAEEESRNQKTFLISSHDLTHVTDICERIVLLEKGKMIKDLKETKETMIEELDNYFGA